MRSKNSKPIDTLERAYMRDVKLCAIRWCVRPIVARGLCQTCYVRLRRRGTLKPIAKVSKKEYISQRCRKDDDGCWLWTSSLNTGGYGIVGKGFGTRIAHRASWMAYNEMEIPKGFQVNHKCHVRSCVNPDHLYLGTQIDNMRDMKLAGRGGQPRGSASGMAKLDENNVRAILQSNEPASQLRVRFGISDSLVRAIRKRIIWKHVDA